MLVVVLCREYLASVAKKSCWRKIVSFLTKIELWLGDSTKQGGSIDQSKIHWWIYLLFYSKLFI